MFSNCKVSYYGKTYHHFFTRAAEHMGISNLTEKYLKCVVKQSVVPGHQLECNCLIDFDHFDILASDAKISDFLLRKVYRIIVTRPS